MTQEEQLRAELEATRKLLQSHNHYLIEQNRRIAMLEGKLADLIEYLYEMDNADDTQQFDLKPLIQATIESLQKDYELPTGTTS